MTKKGLYKLATRPHIFLKDYAKKNKILKLKLKSYTKKAIEVELPFHSYYYNLYLKLNDSKSFALAEDALKKAILLKPDADYYYKLAVLLKRKGQWWQIVEAYEKALELNPLAEKKWHIEYAFALEKMNRFDEVCKVLEPFSIEEQLTANEYFQYGKALEKEKNFILAEEIFMKAIVLDKKYGSKTLGIGIFYEKKGLWTEAIRAYSKKLLEDNSNSQLQYRLGVALDRRYRWQESEEEYLKAIGSKPNTVFWYYKLGFVRERKGDYEGAVEAYAYATDKRTIHTPYWYYRLGYVLEKLERYEDSCNAFLMMKKINLSLELDDNELSHNNLKKDLKEYILQSIDKLHTSLGNDTTNTMIWNKLAYLYIDIEEYGEAATAFENLIARTKIFNGNLYFALGNMLTRDGQYEKASKAFLEQRILQDAHGMSEDKYNKNQGLKIVVNYTEYYERYKIEEETILYESYHGRSISCNPYAIFKELYNDERFKNYKHIWIINNNENIPDELKKDVNIIFVKRESDLYRRYLAKAKYIINNSTLPNYYIRKEGQIYLNTWHGTPIKYMGKDVKNDLMSHTNVAKNFLHATHLIQPNSYTTNILLGTQDVDGLCTGIIAETGYPRQDLMLNISDERKDELYFELNLDKSKKTVLYAPTWRGIFGTAENNIIQLKEDIQALQEVEDVQILFRGHYAVEEAFNDLDFDITVVSSNIDTNSLLSIVDVLITDYSSILFDFMALARPIIYYTYDQDEYEKERGLYFPLEDLGGEICKNQIELKASLVKVVTDNRISTLQKEAQQKYCSYDDGKATKRVIDLVFFDKKSNINIVKYEEKKSILIYGGEFNSNGINTSFINLLNNIDLSSYLVTVLINPAGVKTNEKKLEEFSKISKDIKVIGRVGRMTMTLEEQWIQNTFNSQRTLTNDEMWDKYKTLFKREYKRMFSNAKFDYLIEFNGYGIFWPSLFAFQKNNTIYQHSDMYGEWTMKYPILENIFRLYPFYQNLVSVSEQTMHHNIDNLSTLFNLSIENFKYSDNVQNPKEIVLRAEEPLECINDEKIFQSGKIFINIGRHSPEKDQKKLILAFEKVLKTHPTAKLVNLGSGPLESYLHQIIRKKGLKKSVFFLGQRFNPYPYLKKSSCFVLSSNHEGQPMTLFEALILDKPIIATNIVGNRSVLKGRAGILVENSEEGLVQGMLDFIENRYENDKKFDYEEYNENALNMFYSKILR